MLFRSGYIDREYIASLPAERETEHLKVVRFDEPLTIAINGRKSKGIVFKAK